MDLNLIFTHTWEVLIWIKVACKLDLKHSTWGLLSTLTFSTLSDFTHDYDLCMEVIYPYTFHVLEWNTKRLPYETAAATPSYWHNHYFHPRALRLLISHYTCILPHTVLHTTNWLWDDTPTNWTSSSWYISSAAPFSTATTPTTKSSQILGYGRKGL